MRTARDRLSLDARTGERAPTDPMDAHRARGYLVSTESFAAHCRGGSGA